MLDENSCVITEMPRRNPTNGTFELTIRCNLHCKMCLFRHDDSENKEIIENELSAEQWIDMARQTAEAGTMSLLITGGEPMLRPDFCAIWEGIYKQGFVMELYTNATLVTPKIMNVLKKYPPHKIGVTVYGSSPEMYEKVCGSADAFEKMLAGVYQLQLLPSTIEFRTTMIRENCEDMIAIDRMVSEQFGDECGVVISSEVHQSVRGACADVRKCRLSPSKMREVQREHVIEMAKRAAGNSFDFKQLTFRYTKPEKKDSSVPKKFSFFGCAAGMDRYTITWDGKLLACQILGTFSLSVTEEGFLRAWEKFPFIVKLPKENEKCIKCDVKEYCESCYATRYAETGELNGCSPYIYDNARSKKELVEYEMGGKKDEKNEL